jgi:geranylgeranyl diphosphate synthase type II
MILKDYRERVESSLKEALEEMGPPSRLRDACAYALLGKGKRLRPILVLLIGKALGRSSIIPAALCVEYFHTASLIADDLPCMDNDSLRRGVPSLHVAFDESVALLASYTLIAAGYGAIYEMSKELKRQNDPHADSIAVHCLEVVTRSAGLRGATHGQFLDLFPPDSTLETLLLIIEQKTATLFEIAFLLGWLFGGGDPKRVEEVKKCASYFGVSFQIADDLQDVSQDVAGRMNLVHALGVNQAKKLFEEAFLKLTDSLKELSLWNEEFQVVCAELARAGSGFFEPAVRS